jgi:hypothetical protein
MRRVIGVTTLAAGAALVIAGCGTTHASSGASGSSASSSVTAQSAIATPKQRATADAASILSSFVPPAGADRLSGASAAGPAGSALRAPTIIVQGPGSVADVVDQVSWWRVPGTPQAALAWEKAHLPHRFTAAGTVSAGDPPARWTGYYSLAPVAGVLASRELDVQAVSAGSGKTDLRVDAQVQWVPAKSPSEQVPSSVTAVTVSARTGPVAGAKAPTPVTITNQATVRKLASIVNGLALAPQGLMHCPVSMDRAVQMTFRDGAAGPAAATVTAGLSGCQGVTFYADGKAQPVLAGGGTVAQQVLSITGLHWTGYTPGGAINPGGTERSSGVNPGGTMDQG